jgi:hypothetical protein
MLLMKPRQPVGKCFSNVQKCKIVEHLIVYHKCQVLHRLHSTPLATHEYFRLNCQNASFCIIELETFWHQWPSWASVTLRVECNSGFTCNLRMDLFFKNFVSPILCIRYIRRISGPTTFSFKYTW